jgi:Ca2+-binding RTX toxin-like protein
VNYSSADGPITARLDLTWSSVQVGGQWVHVQSNGGYSLVTSPALPIPWENNWIRGADRVRNIEGIVGTVFADDLRGDGKANRLWGHDGDDVIHGNGGNDHLYGGVGNDSVRGGAGNDHIEGNDGHDDLHGGIGNDTIHGGDGNDEIHGQDGNDLIQAGDGNDDVLGGRGADVIHGGDGSNDLYGDAGNDMLHLSGFGTNHVDGGSGVDTIVFVQQAVVNLFNGFAQRGPQGVEGTDSIVAVENVTTAQHADAVIGTDGRNVIRTNGGDDWVMALGGNDEIHAGTGADTVLGGAGNDVIRGEDGNDRLEGGDGDDIIWGGHGVDVIRGGAGADQLWGNQPLGLASQIAVKDVFVWAAGEIGLDTVGNFSLAHDKLRFDPGFLAAGDAEDNLLVFANGSGAMLAANIAGHGWDFIASFDHVNAIALEDAIDSGAIFDVETTGLGDGAPDGFGLPDPVEVALGVTLQIMF